MTKPIIAVDGISKAYRIGLEEQGYPTFREALVGAVKAPFRRFEKLRERINGDDVIWALKDVSFEVWPGEVLGIIGRNGAGKTTLLKVLSKITEPTEGSARLRGRVASLLEVGTGFHPELTGRENIYLNGAVLGMKKAEIDRKFDEIVSFAEVERFIDTPVKRYSSGMYVRLAFAVAAHLEPEILIVDEVLAVGDIQFQKKCLGKMKEASSGVGRTVLFVSHNMDAILSLCSEVIIMDGGRNSRRLPPNEAVVRYVSSFDDNRRELPFLSRPRSQYKPRPPMIRDFASINGQGVNTRTFQSGEQATFEIELGDFADIQHPECCVVLVNERNQRVVMLHSLYHAQLQFGGRSNIKLVCTVPSLPLTPGVYYVEVSLTDPRIIHERVERAAKIEVIFADLLGTGRMPGYSQGHIVLPCEWHVRS